MGLPLFGCVACFGPPAGFFFQFQPRVHKRVEQTSAPMWEMPNFVHVEEMGPVPHGFFQLRGAPRTTR